MSQRCMRLRRGMSRERSLCKGRWRVLDIEFPCNRDCKLDLQVGIRKLSWLDWRRRGMGKMFRSIGQDIYKLQQHKPHISSSNHYTHHNSDDNAHRSSNSYPQNTQHHTSTSVSSTTDFTTTPNLSQAYTQYNHSQSAQHTSNISNGTNSTLKFHMSYQTQAYSMCSCLRCQEVSCCNKGKQGRVFQWCHTRIAYSWRRGERHCRCW